MPFYTLLQKENHVLFPSPLQYIEYFQFACTYKDTVGTAENAATRRTGITGRFTCSITTLWNRNQVGKRMFLIYHLLINELNKDQIYTSAEFFF